MSEIMTKTLPVPVGSNDVLSAPEATQENFSKRGSGCNSFSILGLGPVTFILGPLACLRCHRFFNGSLRRVARIVLSKARGESNL